MSESQTEKNLYISENGVISLEIEEDYDLDLALKLFIKTSNNLKLEIKYPNLNKLNSSFLVGNNYLKNVFVNLKPIKKDAIVNSLCESMLGLYSNRAFDPISKEYKLIVQGFVPHKPLSKQQTLKIGDLIVTVNDININSDNIEAVLSSIKRPEKIRITAISPITFANLNTTDQILKAHGIDLNKPKEKTKVFATKSTSVVKGDRVKPSIQSLATDDLFLYVMILSLNQGTLKRKQSLKEKNDLVYKYPSNESKYCYKKQNNLILAQFVEQIRGLFMTLGYAIKDINKNDQAICSTIEYQDQMFNVCFLGENYGNKGLLVLIVPTSQLDVNYLKIVAKNLNETFKFTFGNILSDLVNRPDNELTGSAYDDQDESSSIRNQLDTFFHQFHKTLLTSSLFYLFNTTSTLSSQNSQILKDMQLKQDKLTSLNRIKIYTEMRSRLFDSIRFNELPYNLKTDIDMALSELESQEFIDLESNYNRNRRMFLIVGTCLFFQNSLIASHLNDSMTRNIYNYCVHYDLFNLIRNGNTNQFQIWKEVELSNKDEKSRHFLIIVGFREFMAAMILETGGKVARQFEKNKQIEPNPFYIQQVSYMLLDLDSNGVMDEINKYFTFGPTQIIFNLNKFITLPKKRINHRSRSTDGRKNTESRHSPSPSRGLIQETENSDSNQPNQVNFSDSDTNHDNIYHSKKLNRHGSLLDLNRISSKGQFTSLESENQYFSDLSLNNSIIYYASSDNKTNGIIFSHKKYDLNSNLFARMFYNYIQSCFKIKKLFDNCRLIGSNENYQVLEQGVLFNLLIEDESKTKSSSQNVKIDKTKLKELNFWIVGRRKFQRLNANSEWVNLGDFFICFHDNLDDILIELAFDFGFSKLNF